MGNFSIWGASIAGQETGPHNAMWQCSSGGVLVFSVAGVPTLLHGWNVLHTEIFGASASSPIPGAYAVYCLPFDMPPSPPYPKTTEMLGTLQSLQGGIHLSCINGGTTTVPAGPNIGLPATLCTYYVVAATSTDAVPVLYPLVKPTDEIHFKIEGRRARTSYALAALNTPYFNLDVTGWDGTTII